MTVAHIRFATDILRRLGEELNPSPDQGIVELVKNAYDADARTCSVELINTDQPGGSVRVKDDGDGLDSQRIVDGWLVVGRSIKTRRERTRLGRIPAGSKGLGRLAALRMGDFAKLTSWPRWEESAEYLLKIDWRDFEDVHLVDEVELNISRSSRQAGAHQGTEILLEKLRSGISRVDVSRLARALVLLADPFEDNPIGFRPTLAAPEYADLEALVRNRYFQEADYHLATALDERGHATAVVKDWKGKELFEGSHKELTAGRDNRPYECPEASFDLWAFILNKAAFSARSVSLSAVREWLKVFGGVHLYHNGLRVSPYGNPGNDWLDLNLQRVKSPEERPSTNTSIGRIAVTDTSEQLIQKTDRSGFIEDHAFAELRSLAQDALDWMARRRLDAALRRRATEKASGRRTSDRSKKSLQRAIEGAPKAARVELQEAFTAYDRSREREVRDLRKEIQLYRTLGTAGITAATFAHESSGNPIKVITNSIQAVERRARAELGGRYQEVLQKPVESIVQAVDALSVLSTVTLRLIDHGKRRVGRVDIHRVIKGLLDTFEPFFKGRDVTVEPDFGPGEPFLRGSEAAVESIVTNLLNNSLVAFERSNTTSRRILVRTSVRDGTLTLQVMDNGPGIRGIDPKDIWLPGESTRPNGTGLGLAIVRDTVIDLGGDAEAIPRGELGGAEIVIRLPLLGS